LVDENTCDKPFPKVLKIKTSHNIILMQEMSEVNSKGTCKLKGVYGAW